MKRGTRMISSKELLKRMTLREKLAQMTQLNGHYYEMVGTAAITGPIEEMNIKESDIMAAGSVLGTTGAKQVMEIQNQYLKNNPHGIPLLFMADVIHGYRTIFPVPLALGCTWDPELVERSMRAAAKEAAAAGVHVNFSPMVDTVRDPRWGRVMESTGEDPYLNCMFARAFVKGYQGESLAAPGTLAACVKHFAGYGAAEAGRDYNTVELSSSTLNDHYLPAYRAAVDEGCEMVMTSFNTLDGVPSTCNQWLMRDLLRKTWGFEGTVISDWGAVHELIAHGVAEDDCEAAQKAITAGVDIEMMTAAYLNFGEELAARGLLSENTIDEAVERILDLKIKLGLFENPHRFANPEEEAELLLCSEHRSLAREAAAASLVLLKNDENLLPLSSEGVKIALVGPYAAANHILGGWSCEGRDEEAVTLREGLEALLPSGALRVAAGCGIEDGSDESMAEAAAAAMDSDIVIAAVGEDPGMSGEAGCRGFLTLPGRQQELLNAVYAAGKKVIVVLFNGRPLDLRPILEHAHALVEAWFPGTEGGSAIAEVLLGIKAPTGRLTMSFPYSVGQIPVYYNHHSTGRPKPDESCTDRFYSMFLDMPNSPLLPFGYGLTYTSFQYEGIAADTDTLTPGSALNVSAVVKNTGDRPGTETVQLYIRDHVGSRSRPVMELKGFKKVQLKPGESRRITFTVTEDMLRFTTLDGNFESEPGRFTAMIGPNAADVLSVSFYLEK